MLTCTRGAASSAPSDPGPATANHTRPALVVPSVSQPSQSQAPLVAVSDELAESFRAGLTGADGSGPTRLNDEDESDEDANGDEDEETGTEDPAVSFTELPADVKGKHRRDR